MKPLDILSRYKFFLPFNSSESADGHKTCRDTLNANLPALPWTGYTVSNTVHTTCGISSIPPAPLPTIPDSNWIKGNLSTKKNNKPIKLFVLKKKKKKHHQYYLSFSEHSLRVQDSGKPCEFWCYTPYDARLMQLCLLSVSLLSISDTIPGGHHTLDPRTKYPAISDIGLIKL